MNPVAKGNLVSVILVVAVMVAAGWWFGYQEPRNADARSCEVASAADTEEAWIGYRATHPDGVCAARAEVRLGQFAACAAARKEGTERAWRAYLEANPGGQCAAEAGEALKPVHVQWVSLPGGACRRKRSGSTRRAAAARRWSTPWGDEKASCRWAIMYDGGNGCGSGGTNPACSRPAGNSAQGLCDLVGNVWEWCTDWYGAYPSSPENDPTGPASGSARVLRGGSWYYSNPVALRAAYRNRFLPSDRRDDLGFRCAAGAAARAH
jgi:formylglycine-generating enzyme required for sulfatase activity